MSSIDIDFAGFSEKITLFDINVKLDIVQFVNSDHEMKSNCQLRHKMAELTGWMATVFTTRAKV